MLDTVCDPPARVKPSRDEAAARLKAALLAFRGAKRAFRASGSEARRAAMTEAAGELSDAFDAHPAPRPMLRLGGLVYAWNRATLLRFVEVAPWKAVDVEPMRVRLLRRGGSYALRHEAGDTALVVLVRRHAGLLYVAIPEGPAGGPTTWIEDAEFERRVAAGNDVARELPPVSASPYAREFRAMRGRWYAMKQLFVVE